MYDINILKRFKLAPVSSLNSVDKYRKREANKGMPTFVTAPEVFRIAKREREPIYVYQVSVSDASCEENALF